MLTYLVSVQNAAGAVPLFASLDGAAAQRTAVGLSQDHPEALITTTPVEFHQTCLTGSSLLMLPSPIRLGQIDGLVELLASECDPDSTLNVRGTSTSCPISSLCRALRLRISVRNALNPFHFAPENAKRAEIEKHESSF